MSTPLRSHLVRASCLIATLALLTPATAEAQLGGLKKRLGKAAAAAVGVETESSAEAAVGGGSSGGSSYGEYVVVIDGGSLDRLEKGLAAESAERVKVAEIIASHPSPEALGQCQMRVAQGAEIQALLTDYTAAMDKAGDNQQAALDAMQKLDKDMRAIYARECGEELSWEREQELQKRPEIAGSEAAGMTDVQYGILKERIAPFCMAGGSLQATGNGASVPVDGMSVAYVYTSAEMEALAPRCEALMGALPDAA